MIVLSDFDNEHTVKQLKALGVQEYWMKVDNTPHILVEKINTLINRPTAPDV